MKMKADILGDKDLLLRGAYRKNWNIVMKTRVNQISQDVEQVYIFLGQRFRGWECWELGFAKVGTMGEIYRGESATKELKKF